MEIHERLRAVVKRVNKYEAGWDSTKGEEHQRWKSAITDLLTVVDELLEAEKSRPVFSKGGAVDEVQRRLLLLKMQQQLGGAMFDALRMLPEAGDRRGAKMILTALGATMEIEVKMGAEADELLDERVRDMHRDPVDSALLQVVTALDQKQAIYDRWVEALSKDMPEERARQIATVLCSDGTKQYAGHDFMDIEDVNHKGHCDTTGCHHWMTCTVSKHCQRGKGRPITTPVVKVKTVEKTGRMVLNCQSFKPRKG